ncbi:phosphate ABC transporter permease PstA [Tautonia sociabilis]|uniref:Phosphate transport system permease protein PstA n=1 Tax=Tautonia sociabilis TaxID=2080755 RepID=A0A432MRQ0_9BACT|nr:phosphate ABC transporter permease PstA [Tautonia sociabilis]RUL89625.1 phosphate ABC transporter permease PstA [Tautonia sociabilis]
MSRASDALYRPRRGLRRALGAGFAGLCLAATLSGVVVLVVLLGAVLVKALALPPNPPWFAVGEQLRELAAFLSRIASSTNSPNPELAGFKAGIIGSLWLLLLVALIAIPVGVGAGLYLEEYAPAGRLRRAIQTNIANLAGVPSIVYGILGLVVFSRAFGFQALALGKMLWAGALTLSLLVLPIVVIATQEALRAVPPSLRQAALALGATRWQVIRDHVLPSALPGILTGTILALSRAIGETAPLLMVGAANSILFPPSGPSDYYTALPVEIYNFATLPREEFRSVAAGGILILLGILLSMNAVAIFLRTPTGQRAASRAIAQLGRLGWSGRRAGRSRTGLASAVVVPGPGASGPDSEVAQPTDQGGAES